MEGDFIGIGVNTRWVIRSGFVEEENVDHRKSSDYKGEEEVEGEESSKGGIIDGKPPSDSLHKAVTDIRDSGHKVSNNSGPSEGYLTSGEDIAYEGGCHNKKKKYYTHVSCFFKQE